MRGKKKRVPTRGKETRQPVSKVSLSIPRRYGFVIPLLLITIMAILIYSNTFSSPFHFDDEINIVENYQIRDLSNFWPPSGTRYIGYLSFAINYYLGRLDVFGYHLVNIITHIINGMLVRWLVILTFKTPVMNGAGISKLKGAIALTSALFFVSHPVQTQAVTYIVQRFASLATLFYLLSLIMYIKARLRGSISSISFLSFYLLSLSSAILAMKTKEISFTLPFIIVLYEFTFMKIPPNPPLINVGISMVKRLLYLIPFLIPLLIIPLRMIGADKPLGDMIGEMRMASQETEDIPRGDYLLTQFRVIVTYIRLLLLPVNQNLDYDYPLYGSFFKPEVFLSFLFLLLIFGLAVYLFVRARKSGSRHLLLVSFGILWFFITLSVESSIIPIRDVIFEHRLYLPGVGAVIAFSAAIFCGLEHIRLKPSPLTVTSVLLLITVIPLGIATYNRNWVWRDRMTLWEDVVRKSPGKARGYTHIGVAYYDMGWMDAAIQEYRKALRIKPDDPYAHYNLGVAYYEQGRMDEAIDEYRKALRFMPNFPDAYYNLAKVYESKGLIDMAIQELMTALRVDPNYIDAHFNLGIFYKNKGLKKEAIREFEEVLRLNPQDPEASKLLGSILY